MLRKAYLVICMIFANKEIMRRSDPDDQSAPLRSLERTFFESELSRLLIEIAISVRVIDDQMRTEASDDHERVCYENRKQKRCDWAMFDDLDLNLRKVCNKIIHLDVMQLYVANGVEAHAFDACYLAAEAERSINWKHLDGFIRLAGMDRGKSWFVLLDVEVFVQALFEIFCSEFTTPQINLAR